MRATLGRCLRNWRPVENLSKVPLTEHSLANVRFESKADSAVRLSNVRFTPNSGHRLNALGCPLCANNRHVISLD